MISQTWSDRIQDPVCLDCLSALSEVKSVEIGFPLRKPEFTVLSKVLFDNQMGKYYFQIVHEEDMHKSGSFEN